MRLDISVYKNGLAESRSRARALIEAGSISVGGVIVKKPAFECGENMRIELTGEPLGYVSRGGYKLAAALDGFGINAAGLVAVDIGASTGGFTECLLIRGARKVYAVDSGRRQLAAKLRADPRVVALERVNARTLTAETLGEFCGLAVMDVSFISQTKLHSATASLLERGGVFISLIKPQFEAGREHIGKGGIVRDRRAREFSIEMVTASAEQAGFSCRGLMTSPITGGDGNIEFLGYFEKII